MSLHLDIHIFLLVPLDPPVSLDPPAYLLQQDRNYHPFTPTLISINLSL